MELRHDSVFLEEAVEGLRVAPGDVVVDATVGGAGHFSSILSSLSGSGTLIGIDADKEALQRAREASKDETGVAVHLVEENFRNLEKILDTLDIKEVSGVLFDLGWSGFHLGSGRGFSFRTDEPLHMTYGEPEEGKSAAYVVNHESEETLSDILFSLGEERFARHIAKGIVRARKERHLVTTADLVEVIAASTPSWYQHRRLHPATKTFQALRMYVNDELGALREGLSAAFTRLAPSGRVAVITFHSIEDRIVKSMMRDAAHQGVGMLVTKKPLLPSEIERKKNPRARSAKLRVFEKSLRSHEVDAVSSSYTYA